MVFGTDVESHDQLPHDEKKFINTEDGQQDQTQRFLTFTSSYACCASTEDQPRPAGGDGGSTRAALQSPGGMQVDRKAAGRAFFAGSAGRRLRLITCHPWKRGLYLLGGIVSVT